MAHLYEELNREAKYFDALVRLFDLYLAAERVPDACEILDRLVDIDPYDYRNQERIAHLEGKADPVFLQNILARAAKAATVSGHTGSGFSGAGSDVAAAAAPVSEEVRAQQALEDLIVQVEIFLQYSLHTKAIERLERIGELFPGEEEKNERLRTLYERANWWPKGAPRKPAPQPPPAPPVCRCSGRASAVSRRACTASRSICAFFRGGNSPRSFGHRRNQSPDAPPIHAARGAVGHGGGSRQISRRGAMPGDPGLRERRISIDGRIFRAGPAGRRRRASAGDRRARFQGFSPDDLGGIQLTASSAPVLRELGVESALAVVLQDKEAGAQSGILLVADKSARKWKPNESFFLQAVGDQLVLSVNHTRLRSLVRSLAVADEKTGLLSRGAYVDCLLVESNRARSQNTPLSLIILHVDHGGDLLRQHGDAAVDQYIEQLARALSSTVRQTDIAVKYTAWSLAFILPDTSIENARCLAEKLLQVAATVHPSWGSQSLSASAVVAEASSRPGDDTEDRVTEWINRAEAGLDQAFQNGGNVLVPLATP